ncbi:hypothetical protein Micbo1qcDRAFT_214061 [Microdochium bolleyi]|uniref:Uncharacterized protein n=1 Tax=Microdochium bolleyi TaxID=196109 RepID=A0A136IVJ2_9PEZI|nr:hypothetical protein Micbo1qcDRAFT_214061 [Microdochium bolleyi]
MAVGLTPPSSSPMDQERRHRPSRKPVRFNEAYESLVQAARDLRIRAQLTGCQRRRVLEAVAVLHEAQAGSKKQEYRVFLHHVHRRAGPHCVLLCACQLGQHKVTTMRKADRTELIDRLERERAAESISCPVLHRLATQHGIPEFLDGCAILKSDAQTSGSSFADFGTTIQSTGTASYVNYGDPRLTLLEGYDYPYIESVVEVLGEALGASVRRIPLGAVRRHVESADKTCGIWSSPSGEEALLDSAWGLDTSGSGSSSSTRSSSLHEDDVQLFHQTHQHRAAATIAFPEIGNSAVECLISLDLQDWSVETLARNLFGIETLVFPGRVNGLGRAESSSKSARTVAALGGCGARLTTWAPEVTLTGVKRAALLDVLGPELDRAMQTSFIRRVESLAGRDETDCVSMSLTENGAFLNLALSREGIRIWRRLTSRPRGTASEQGLARE